MSRKISILLTLMLIFHIEVVFARRSMPEWVQPVISNGIRYLVPHVTLKYEEEHGYPSCPIGCIEAWDIKTETLLWRIQVYKIDYGQPVEVKHDQYTEIIIGESDVLDDYVASLKITQGSLFVETERGKKFIVNLKTKAVKNL